MLLHLSRSRAFPSSVRNYGRDNLSERLQWHLCCCTTLKLLLKLIALFDSTYGFSFVFLASPPSPSPQCRFSP